MAKLRPETFMTTLLLVVLFLSGLIKTTISLTPYPKSIWGVIGNDNMMMMPYEDPLFKILDQTALARADWREGSDTHVIEVEIPGMRKDDVKVEVDESDRVLRISGERTRTEERGGEDKWHRSERVVNAKFSRGFKMPVNADLGRVKADLNNGVLRLTVPKLAEEEEKKKRLKVIDIQQEDNNEATNSVSASTSSGNARKSEL